MQITRKTKKIELNGKEYMCQTLFMDSFSLVTMESVRYHRKKGLPCIKVGGMWWYNKEDCRKWYAGKI